MGQAASTSERPLYSPLPNPTLKLGDLSKWTRMLRILPASCSSPIKCKLKLVNLAFHPDFEALSYVWGCPDPSQEIDLDGHRKSVTPNLFAALRRLRLPNKERLVWIDALCINQEDLEERSRQVLLMRDIYAKPTRVIVWLGEDNGLAAEAIRILQKAEEYFYLELGKTPQDDIQIADFAAIAHEDWGLFTPHGSTRDLPPLQAEELHFGWGSVKWFYGLPWFKRLWVMQEVAFSAALMYVGDLEIDWNCVKVVAWWLLRKGYGVAVDCEYAIGISIGPLANRLASLMYFLRNSEATEPRDKVFALLGLLGATTRGHTLLQPDYTKSVVDVYIDALRYMIEGDQDGAFFTDLIGYTAQGPAESDDEYPSWVPRFDKESRMTRVLHPHLGSQSRIIVREATDRNILVLKGAKVTTISMADHTLHGQHGKEDKFKELWEKTVKWLGPEYTPEALEEAFIRIVTSSPADSPRSDLREQVLKEVRSLLHGSTDSPEPSQQNRSLSEVTEEAVARKLRRDNSDMSAAELRLLLDKYSLKEHFEDGVKSIGFQYVASEFAFLITSDGKMGLGSKIARPGDVVCVFHGAKYPFLLRPTAESFRFLGQCYIQDLMNGEALEELEAGRIKEEWISLR